MTFAAIKTTIGVFALSALVALGATFLAPAAQADEFSCGAVAFDVDGVPTGTALLRIDADGVYTCHR